MIIASNVSKKFGKLTALDNVSVTCTKGECIALIGPNGSGKTTLIKLLLGFYEPTKGSIIIGGIPMESIYQKVWRAQCGVVMQEGFIFSDTIARNIAVGVEIIDRQKLYHAAQVAIYKNPAFLFFDEATNALDANNEKVIMENLNHFMQGRTAIIVAHRLSTVKNADQIIVLEKGKVVESGTHQSLVALKGYYYTLVKNQLDLGD